MPRAVLLALAVSLIGGCKPAADAEPLDSPADSIAKSQTGRSGLSSKLGSGPSLAAEPRLQSSLVSVATTSASEAQPCERVCGSLGDCLLADDDYTALVAGGLELERIDRCVHSADGSPAKSALLACAAKTECGQLEACVEQTWAALGDARRSPGVVGIASTDPCKSGCRWLFSCMFTHAPPGEAYLDPQFELQMNQCVEGCDEMSASEREQMSHWANCLPDNCTAELVTVCWNY